MVLLKGMKISKQSKINFISGIFYTTSALFILKTILILLSLLKLDKTVGSFHAPTYYFLEFYFYFLFLPVLFSLSSVLFFYCGLKIRDRSPLGWLLGLIFSLVVPFSLWYIGKIIIEPTTFHTFGPWWKDYTLISGIILFILLIAGTRLFEEEGKPIKKKFRIFIALFFSLICLPTIFFLFYIQFRIKTRDYDYPRIQKLVNYPVYRPNYFPDGRVYETNFFTIKKGIAPPYTTVEFNVNFPLSKIMQIRKSGLILVKQSKVDTKFNVENFIKQKTEMKIPIKKINVPLQKDTTYFANGKSRKVIVIPTKQNTVIFIDGFYIKDTEIIKFAQSFQ